MAEIDAQYAIDIAAEMPGGDVTLSQLDKLTDTLIGGGKEADVFQRAMLQASDALATSKLATSAANDELVQSQAEYKSLERAAVKSAKAAEKAAIDVNKVLERESDRAAAAAERASVRETEARAAAAEAQVALAQSSNSKTIAIAEKTAKALTRASAKASDAAANAADKQAKAAQGGIADPSFAAAARDSARAVEAYASTLEKAETKARETATAQDKLSDTLKNVNRLNKRANDRLGESATRLSTLRGALGDVGGPLGELGERALFPAQAFVDLSETMGRAQATAVVAVVGFAAIAAAIVVLTAIVAAATVAFVAWGVAMASTTRTAGLAREAAEALNPELAQIRDTVDRLADETGLAIPEINKLAVSLSDAKVSADQLPAALQAAALAEKALGAGGAAKFIAEIKSGKLAVDEFATNTQVKFGGIVARQMLGLGEQSSRLKRNFSEVFGELDIDPVLRGFRTLVGLFDQSSAAGRAMKAIFEGTFRPLIDQVDEAATVVEAFAIGFLIGLTKMYLTVKPTIERIKDFFGFEDTSLRDVLDAAGVAGKIASGFFVLLVGTLTLLAAGVAAVVGGIALLLSVVPALGVAVVAATAAIINGLSEVMIRVVEFFTETDFKQIGVDMMLGVAKGITSAAKFVVSAVSDAMSGALSTAKKVLGIQSPSKEFASVGEDTGAGMVKGVDDTAPDVDRAVREMAEPPSDIRRVAAVPAPITDVGNDDIMRAAPPSNTNSRETIGQGPALTRVDDARGNTVRRPRDDRDPPGAPAVSSPAQGASSTANLQGSTFNFYGVEGAEDAEARFAEMLTKVVEGDAAQLGEEEVA